MSEPKITKSDILEKTPQRMQKQLYVVHTKSTSGLVPVMENIGCLCFLLMTRSVNERIVR